MTKKQEKSHLSFFVGSWVGMIQAAIGMIVAARLGPVAGFIASLLIYLSLYNVYTWISGGSDERS